MDDPLSLGEILLRDGIQKGFLDAIGQIREASDTILTQ